MKNFAVVGLSFLVSFAIAYQVIRIPASQIPFHGEAFVGAKLTNGMIYLVTYLVACAYFSIQYAKTCKAKYIFRLACFLGATALAGYAINRCIFYDALTNGVWQ